MHNLSTVLLNGGLYQMIFCRLLFFFFLLESLSLSSKYSSPSVYPLFLSALLYSGVASRTVSWLDEISVSRLLIAFGICLMIVGG